MKENPGERRKILIEDIAMQHAIGSVTQRPTA